MGILLGGLFIAGYFTRGWVDIKATSDTSFALLNEIEGLLQGYYLYDLPGPNKLVEGAAAGLVSSLADPYTYYTEPETAEVQSDDLSGEFGGIGAEITIDDEGKFVIAHVFEEGPAAVAGIRDGDILLQVDEAEVAGKGLDTDGVVSLIRGEVGTEVKLVVLRGIERLSFTVIRERIEVPSVLWQMSEEDDRIGIITIIQFTARTSDEMRTALSELASSGAEAFVLDLRNNGGGLLDSAVDVASYFLQGKVILYEVENQGAEQEYLTRLQSRVYDDPLVILVNGFTASASEILAGALQDHERAQLVGDVTYGKGTVQAIFDLSDGSTLRVTNAEWFTPLHNKIQGIGLSPDIVIPLGDSGDDQLAAALAHLQGLLD